MVSRYKPGTNSDEAIEQRWNFARKMIEILKRNYICIFIDEAGVNFEEH